MNFLNKKWDLVKKNGNNKTSKKYYKFLEFFRKRYFGYNKINYLISDFSFAKTFKQRIKEL